MTSLNQHGRFADTLGNLENKEFKNVVVRSLLSNQNQELVKHQ
jgi:hypothetical protein